MRLLVLVFSAIATIGHGQSKVVEVSDVGELRAAIAGDCETIRLKPGVYRLATPVVIKRPVSLQGGGKAVLTGSDFLPTPWRQVEPGIWQNTVPDTWGDVHTLFLDGEWLPRARSGGLTMAAEPPTSVPYRLRRAIDGSYGYLPRVAFEKWEADTPDAEIRVIPQYPWLMGLLPIESANRETGLVRSSRPMIYDLKPPVFGHFPDGHAWIENTRAAMDEIGEWFFIKKSRDIFIRFDSDPGKRVEVARLTELLRIEGQENSTDYEDNPVSNVRLEGLTFTGARRYQWPTDKTGWGLQHDWEFYDRPTAMVRLRFTEDCVIENCQFIDSGAAGLRMDLHARRNRVSRSEFSRLGGVGVLLAGYGMGYKDVNRENRIADCRFSQIGQEWWGSPAIFLWQSGSNEVVHNVISDVPYTGIVVSTRTQPSPGGLKESSKTIRIDEVINHFESNGRTWKAREPLLHGGDNEISWNQITGVMQKLSDGNAIYISGTAGGSHIHHNWIHDVDSRNINANLRIDDDQHGVVISQNAITHCTGEGIVVKGFNKIQNNVVWKLRQRTRSNESTYFSRGYLVISSNVGKATKIERNVFVHNETRHPPLFERTQPWRRGSTLVAPVTLSQTSSNQNLWWSASHPNWAADMLAAQRELGVETDSVSDLEPTFQAPEEGNFFPANGTEWAKKIEFQGFDLRDAGPRDNQ